MCARARDARDAPARASRASLSLSLSLLSNEGEMLFGRVRVSASRFRVRETPKKRCLCWREDDLFDGVRVLARALELDAIVVEAYPQRTVPRCGVSFQELATTVYVSSLRFGRSRVPNALVSCDFFPKNTLDRHSPRHESTPILETPHVEVQIAPVGETPVEAEQFVHHGLVRPLREQRSGAVVGAIQHQQHLAADKTRVVSTLSRTTRARSRRVCEREHIKQRRRTLRARSSARH